MINVIPYERFERGGAVFESITFHPADTGRFVRVTFQTRASDRGCVSICASVDSPLEGVNGQGDQPWLPIGDPLREAYLISLALYALPAAREAAKSVTAPMTTTA